MTGYYEEIYSTTSKIVGHMNQRNTYLASLCMAEKGFNGEKRKTNLGRATMERTLWKKMIANQHGT